MQLKLFQELSEERRGPGLWKFNNALFDDEEYLNRIWWKIPRLEPGATQTMKTNQMSELKQ